jgi:transcriptional regulator with XRE-family HTH domain
MSELKEIRQARRLSLEAVGYLAGVDAATISRIENGQVQPRRETVVRIAQALGVAVSRIAPSQEVAL